jgi:hypothetical protein
MASTKYWEMLDTDHPEYVTDTVGLVNWSHNCSHPTPFALFLDLIGWSETELGENITSKLPNLGYTELDYLAGALVEYSKRPQDVHQWVNQLMREESE